MIFLALDKKFGGVYCPLELIERSLIYSQIREHDLPTPLLAQNSKRI
jgi:hypothetical protein